MDSLDAQCLLLSMSADEGCAPPFWVHARDGSLGYRFPSSPKTWSWPAEDVADIAERWRAGEADSPPEPVGRIVAAHTAFIEMLKSGEFEQPDVIVHDLEAVEIRALWHDSRLEVVVDIADSGRAIESLAERDVA